METNPNLTDTIDFSVNEKTAYISLDGQYGLRIVTKLPADNILKRSSVQLDQWAEAGQESNPNAYAHGLHQRTCPQPERRNGRHLQRHISSLPTPTSHLCDAQECEFMLTAAPINVHDGYCRPTSTRRACLIRASTAPSAA
ncbi:MAG: hypothetical protein ACLRMJ_03685 [Alistipes finegoldii]